MRPWTSQALQFRYMNGEDWKVAHSRVWRGAPVFTTGRRVMYAVMRLASRQHRVQQSVNKDEGQVTTTKNEWSLISSLRCNRYVNFFSVCYSMQGQY